MTDLALIAEAEALVALHGDDSPLVRLATLASPACRVEPELLRRLRRRCVPDADVSVEQELWFSELVASRGPVITFTPAATHVLRDRLRDLHQRLPELVDEARDEIIATHAHLPGVLRLEDELAWAGVVGDGTTIQSRAEAILDSLRAGRDGLDEWLARAWPALPSDLKRTDSGRQLAEVAASRGAAVEQDVGSGDIADLVDLLPSATLLIDRRGAELRINVAPDDATIAIDVPDTRAKMLEVRAGDQAWSVEARAPTSLDVGHGVVTLVTESGAEYELEAPTEQHVFSVELLPAGFGTSVLITYGDHDDQHHVLIDTGPSSRQRDLASDLERRAVDRLELLVLTHIDDNAIGGAAPFLEAPAQDVVGDIWFNGRDHLDTGRDGKDRL